jgi:hypothetical protein
MLTMKEVNCFYGKSHVLAAAAGTPASASPAGEL